ncbi:MAG: SpoIIE family protein phosphatase, partial [Gemmatimonadetes bacterium]|nr:SpoIIE family protein phosphatase [Gemmatimonadota bacterium]
IVAAFLLIGLVVFLSRSDLVATLFFLMCVLISRIMLPVPELDGKGTMYFDRMGITLATLFLPPVVLHFFLNFPVRTRWATHSRWLPALIYLPSVVTGLVISPVEFDRIVRGIQVPPGANLIQAVTAVLSVGMIATAVGLFVHGARRVRSPVLKRSLKWVLPGTALGILPPLILTVILNINPSLEIPGDRYAFLTFVLVPLSFAHAIFRYGLMDLELVVKRSVVYTALTAMLVAVYYLVAEVLGSWVVARTGTGRTLLTFGVVFGAALAFMPIRDRMQRFVDRTFYRERYNYRTTLRDFSSAFARFLERDELVHLLVDELTELLGVERAALFVRSSPDDSLHLAGSRGVEDTVPPLLHPSPSLLAWWRDSGGPVPVEPARDPRPLARLTLEEVALFDVLEPALLVFLRRERRVEGILFLGPKPAGDPYRAEDLELLATLGDQAGTALSSSRLHEEALERRRMEEELAVARRIQASLLPSEIPQPPGVELTAMTRPCLEIGGDFYDFLRVNGSDIGMAVGDVAGKGVPAALLLSTLQATLRAGADSDRDLEPIIEKINRRLCDDSHTQPNRFASLLYGQLNPADRSFRYVNAGHPAGLVVGRDGSIRRLEEGGLLLGVQSGAEYSVGEVRFEPGETLLLYSDGVTDVLNAEGEDFGPARLEKLLPLVAHLSGPAIIERIVSSVDAFVAGGLPDDLTLLVAKFLPDDPGQQVAV